MNCAHERAAAAERAHREQYAEANAGYSAACFAEAADRLATASRAWRTLAPTSAAEIDAIANQLEGMRIAVGNLRIAMQK